MPSLYSGDLPLSEGGYDFGVGRRTNSLPQILKEQGYRTATINTYAWQSNRHGFNNGYDEIEYHYDYKSLIGQLTKQYKYYLDSGKRIIGGDESYAPFYQSLELLRDTLSIIEHQSNSTLPYRSLCHDRYDLDRLASHIKATFKQAEASISSGTPWDLAAVIRTDSAIRRCIDVASHPSYKSKRRINHAINIITGRIFDQDRLALADPYYIDSSELTDRIINKIDYFQRGGEPRPFFVNAHFLDLHSPYIPFERGAPRADKLRYWKSEEGMTYSERMTFRYKMAINRLFNDLLKIYDHIENIGILENTVIVICADHGEELGEHGEYGHRFRMFDECVRVPLLILDGGEPSENTALGGTVDILPTLLNSIGIDLPSRIEGVNLREAGRSYTLAECFNRGNCAFSYRPIYSMITDGRYKLINREFRDAHDYDRREDSIFFDKSIDPLETHALQNITVEQRSVMMEFDSLVRERGRIVRRRELFSAV